ncbi:MAG: hypothetical protein ACLQGP_19815 [Isosphaeraceae bacterium]
MKRSLASLLCTGMIIGALGMCGCEGGSLQEGAPKDTTPGVPLDTIKANMATPGAKKPGQLPSGEAPKSSSPTP